MDDETRREVDAACLRLMGYKQNDALPSLWFGPYDSATVGKDGPSQDSRHVVPLAEALRERGWDVEVHWSTDGGCYAVLMQPGACITSEQQGTASEALALAAARAVGEEP